VKERKDEFFSYKMMSRSQKKRKKQVRRIRTIPKTLLERPICGQENFGNGQPQRLTQLAVRNGPLRLPLMKLLKLDIEGLESILHCCS
jgi:hypothetical protein